MLYKLLELTSYYTQNNSDPSPPASNQLTFLANIIIVISILILLIGLPLICSTNTKNNSSNNTSSSNNSTYHKQTKSNANKKYYKEFNIDWGITGIYQIKNIYTGKCYIGQSTDIKKRWIYHLKHVNDNDMPDHPLYNDIRKYGIEYYRFSILAKCSAEDLDKLEIYFIKKYNTYKDGYNKTRGGWYDEIDYQTYKKN